MRVTLAVDAGGGRDGTEAADELYDWLRKEPDLRALVRREPAAPPSYGAMGALGELVSLLLAPGGPTAAVGAAVVVWLQNRRGNQTVTINMPDGTQVTVSSEKVRGLTAEGTSELAERVAEAIRRQGSAEPPPPPRAPGTTETAGTTEATGNVGPRPSRGTG